MKAVITTTQGSSTTYYVGNYYEVTNGVVTKYYYAGATRLATRTNGTLSYLLADHLGSTSIVTDVAGTVISDTKYKAWGEVRYFSGTKQTPYTFTGQYSHVTDFGLMFYNARYYDPSLGRFASADSIVPDGVQRYTDPTGHKVWEDDNGNYTQADAEYNRQRLDSLQCQARNETYCSYGELHPVETAAFVFGGLVGSTALEAFVMQGALRWGAVQACVGISACRSVLVYVVALLSTKKPFGGQTVIGSYPEYKNYATASGNTYFDMGTLWNNFESQGLGSLNPEINAKFMDIQIYLVKDFLQVNKGGPSTAIEVTMLLQTGYKLVEPIFSGIYQQFQHP